MSKSPLLCAGVFFYGGRDGKVDWGIYRSVSFNISISSTATEEYRIYYILIYLLSVERGHRWLLECITGPEEARGQFAGVTSFLPPCES